LKARNPFTGLIEHPDGRRENAQGGFVTGVNAHTAISQIASKSMDDDEIADIKEQASKEAEAKNA